MHEYDHHIGDYTRDTVGLSMIEDGAYRRLLDQYYASELPLSNDKSELYRIARAMVPVEKKAVDYVLRKFFHLDADGWHQVRADREIAEYHEKSDKAKAAAALRWQRRTDANADANASPNADADAMRTHEERNASRARPTLHTPPSALRTPNSELQKREVPETQPSTPEPPAALNGQVKDAVGKTEPRKTKTNGAGQQWAHPPYVEATAKTVGIKRRENEQFDDFRDRVFTEVRKRTEGRA